MATIQGCVENFSKMKAGFKPMIEKAIDNADAPDIIQEQLYSGLDGLGRKLAPSYLDDPYFQKYKDLGKRAKAYRDWKARISPPRTSPYGFAARDPNFPNLTIDGTFYRSINSKVENWKITVGSDIKLGADIEQKYGSEIFMLSPKAIEYLQKDYVTPAIKKHLRSYGL